MDNIIEPTMDYDLSKIYLGPPSTLTGGAYFTRLMHNTNKPLFVQTPKSLTKQGFIKNGKKIYTDLMFDNNDTIFINWIENLETRCQELLYQKRDSWFETKLEKDDIESAFTSPIKIFKSGKNYLLRVNVKPNIKIYDENNYVVSMDTVTNENHLISIIEVQGIKFTSRVFQIEIELKQSMIVSPDPFLDECFIKTPIKKVKKEEPLDELIKEPIQSQSQVLQMNDNMSLEEIEINTDIDTDTDINSITVMNTKLNAASNNYVTTGVTTTGATTGVTTGVTTTGVTTTGVATTGVTTTGANNNKKDDDEIILDIEDLNLNINEDDDSHILKEVDLKSNINDLETITLKKPNQVYYEIYQKAREKAKELKKNAILAYLEMKNIKKTYMLDDMDGSDSDFDNFDNESDAESLEDMNY
jgi:hypothetical protein